MGNLLQKCRAVNQRDTEESAYFMRAAMASQPLSNAAFQAAPAGLRDGRTQRNWMA